MKNRILGESQKVQENEMDSYVFKVHEFLKIHDTDTFYIELYYQHILTVLL